MKKIIVSNGETRIGFEFKDLAPDAQDKVLVKRAEFEVETMGEDSPYLHVAEEMERMQTPWFTAAAIYEDHRDSLIDTIEANEYLFEEDGTQLYIVTMVNEKNEPVEHRYKDKYLCTIEII